MKGNIILVIAVLMAFASVGFALPNVAFDSSTPANATWRNGTVGQSLILINVSSNETIHINASTFVQWYNATNASTNVSAIIGQVVNYSGSLSENWTYWRFNLSNDGVHRFDVRVYSANSSSANAVIQRYVYYDNTTPVLTSTAPGNSQQIYDTTSQYNLSIEFTGVDAVSTDTCFYRLDNGSNTVFTSCRNLTRLVDYATYNINFTINDSAGNYVTTYYTFFVNFSGTGGGGGGGGGASTPESPFVNENPASVIQQPAGTYSIASPGPLGDVSNSITSLINSIVDWIRSLLGLQVIAIQQPQQPQSIVQPGDKPSGLFGIWKDY